MRKIYLINRDAYEVYFMERTAKKPSKRDVRAFLQANHPCFDSACLIDRKPRTICETHYDMITVVGNKKTIDAHYWTTSAAIISSSNLAMRKSVIACPGETIHLDGNPRSVPTDAITAERNDYDFRFDTDEDIIAFAKKEKIHARLFGPANYSFLLCASFLLLPILALLLSSTTMRTAAQASATANATASVAEPEKIAQTDPIMETPFFWEIFYRELNAIHAAGSRITEYQYDRKNNPSTLISLEAGSPETVQTDCRTLSINDEVSIPSIKYVDGKAIFTASFEIWPDTKQIPDLRQTLAEVSAFDTFCAQNNFTVSSIQSIPEPDYSLPLGGRQLPRFFDELETYCRTHQLDVFKLHIRTEARTDSFQITLQFNPRSNPYPNKSNISRTNAITAAFGIATKTKTATVQQSTDDPLIGKIESAGMNAIVFRKTAEGKTWAQGEMAK